MEVDDDGDEKITSLLEESEEFSRSDSSSASSSSGMKITLRK